MRKSAILGVFAILALPLPATTLQQLTLPSLTAQCTSIVRGNLQPSYTDLRGSVIFTHYNLQVTDMWKGATTRQLDVAVPGGTLNGMHQVYSGAPTFVPGQDYILFLWTSRSGLTQVMGLSQGLFSVNSASGVPTVARAATNQNLLTASGQSISDTNFSMSLASFRATINQMLSGQGAAN
jgi:hypothetical protein